MWTLLAAAALLGGALAAWADTCSYTYSCGTSGQCAQAMGASSGTKTSSGPDINFDKCESIRKSVIPTGSSPCSCTSGSTADPAGPNVAIGHNLQQNMVSLGANMMVSNIKNPVMGHFMSGFTNSFLQTVFDNQEEAKRQREIMDQQLAQQRRQREEQQRVERQRRIDEMFARLSGELKLEGVPLNVGMKGVTAKSDLQLKGMPSGSADSGLQLKMGEGQANSGGYGLKGLPGVYVGGPADSSASSTPPSGNPNLHSGPGTGTTGPGIPGLPGIYLDRVQPEQAAQLAQAANQLSGPDQAMAQDVALEAAARNPELIGPSDDPKLQRFQETEQQYKEAASGAKSTEEQWNEAQSRSDTDKSVIEMARSKLDTENATPAQQQAFGQMLREAKTSEDAAEAARKIFDGANANLSITRTNAANALAALAPPAAGTSVVDLRSSTKSMVVANLKTPDRTGASVAPALPPVTPSATSVTKVVPTQEQMRTRLAGLQNALRRLSEDERKRGVARAAAAKDVDDAVTDAEERGVGMLFDLLSTGWDNCAPLAQGGVVGKFERDAARIPGQIEDVYKEASVAKDAGTLGSFNDKKEQLDRTKIWLQDSIEQIKRFRERVSEFEAAQGTKELLEKSNGDWETSLEGLHKTIEMGLDDKPIAQYLEQAAGLAGCHVVALKATSSAVNSIYDVFKEGDAAVELRTLDENTTRFLEAQKLLDLKLKTTVSQLNCYKIQDAASATTCIQAAGKQ